MTSKLQARHKKAPHKLPDGSLHPGLTGELLASVDLDLQERIRGNKVGTALELGLLDVEPRVQGGTSAAPRLGPDERVWEVAFPYAAVERPLS